MKSVAFNQQFLVKNVAFNQHVCGFAWFLHLCRRYWIARWRETASLDAGVFILVMKMRGWWMRFWERWNGENLTFSFASLVNVICYEIVNLLELIIPQNDLMAIFTRPSAILYRLRETDGLNTLWAALQTVAISVAVVALRHWPCTNIYCFLPLAH